MAEPAHIRSHTLTREEQESLCARMLYYRTRLAFPGLKSTDIQKVMLRDGTALFGIAKVGIHTATVAIRREIRYCGSLHWDDPQLDISIRAPWAYMALTMEGTIITHKACLRPIIVQSIKESLESQIRGYCAYP